MNSAYRGGGGRRPCGSRGRPARAGSRLGRQVPKRRTINRSSQAVSLMAGTPSVAAVLPSRGRDSCGLALHYPVRGPAARRRVTRGPLWRGPVYYLAHVVGRARRDAGIEVLAVSRATSRHAGGTRKKKKKKKGRSPWAAVTPRGDVNHARTREDRHGGAYDVAGSSSIRRAAEGEVSRSRRRSKKKKKTIGRGGVLQPFRLVPRADGPDGDAPRRAERSPGWGVGVSPPPPPPPPPTQEAVEGRVGGADRDVRNRHREAARDRRRATRVLRRAFIAATDARSTGELISTSRRITPDVDEPNRRCTGHPQHRQANPLRDRVRASPARHFEARPPTRQGHPGWAQDIHGQRGRAPLQPPVRLSGSTHPCFSYERPRRATRPCRRANSGGESTSGVVEEGRSNPRTERGRFTYRERGLPTPAAVAPLPPPLDSEFARTTQPARGRRSN